MKYQLNSLIVIIGLLFFSGCDDVNSPNNHQQYYKEFNGKWKIVYSLSDHPIDADLDGKASRFLLDEIPNWDNAVMPVLILKDSDYEKYPNLIFVPYPRQYFPPETNLGDPGFFINYGIREVTRRFKITRNKGQLSIQLQPKTKKKASNLPHCKSIKIKNSHLILEVVIEERLLTAEGWQTVKITSRYARILATT